MNISQYIESARIARGFTYDQFATRSGLSKGYLFSATHNETNIGIYTLAKIAKALDVKLADIVSVLDNEDLPFSEPLPFEENNETT